MENTTLKVNKTFIKLKSINNMGIAEIEFD